MILSASSGSKKFRAHAALLGVAVLLLACRGEPDGGVTISGDVDGLDSIGLRGAALLADAERAPSLIDSLRAEAEGRAMRPTAAESTVVDRPLREGENPMTLRAQARGDSMAQAAANRLVSGSAGGTHTPDSVRGIVTMIGSDPVRQVVLRPLSSSTTIALSGMATKGLTRLEGTELVAYGVKVSSRDIVVSAYVVRAVDGVPAFDGRLKGGAGAWYLDLSEGGRKALPSVPTALRGLSGLRVWVAMPAGGTTIQSFGVIDR